MIKDDEQEEKHLSLFQRFLDFWDVLFWHNLDFPIIMFLWAGMIISFILCLMAILLKFGVV